jgi:hypothetical protein
MKTRILSLRVNRRAIGAAIITADGLTLADGRHLPSGATRAAPAAVRYVDRLLNDSGINAVIVDSPAPRPGSVTDGLLASLQQLLADKGLVPVVIGKSDLLAAYGVQALRSRQELRSVVADYWPDLSRIGGRVRPYAIDAAAAALYAECRWAFSPSPT